MFTPYTRIKVTVVMKRWSVERKAILFKIKSILKTEVVSSSEKLVKTYRTTWRHNTED
jgi:hypothetical protein